MSILAPATSPLVCPKLTLNLLWLPTGNTYGIECFMTSTFAITKITLLLTRTFVRGSLFILIFSTINTLAPLKAEDTVPSENQNLKSPQISILEGKSFSGNIGLLGKPASATDLLLFNDGLFISKGCEKRCGYTAAEYRIRAKGDYFEVISETPCLKSDATIIWRGKVKGNEIEEIGRAHV